jgi:glyoxylase-like metal-dependent hydrolase (beta-lactamase superfamily II)
MPGHMSVVVRAAEVTYFLAADATYSEILLKQRIVDGPSADLQTSLDTLERIAAFARQEPTVLLPRTIPWPNTASSSGSPSPRRPAMSSALPKPDRTARKVTLTVPAAAPPESIPPPGARLTPRSPGAATRSGRMVA